MTKTDDIIEGLEGDIAFLQAHPNLDDNMKAIIVNQEAAINHLKAMQWVPIADIPEEWKDGRPVWLFFINTAVTGPLSLEERFRGEYARILKSFPEYCCWQKASWSKHNGGGWIWEGMSGTPFFVMPPIAPPALGKPEE